MGYNYLSDMADKVIAENEKYQGEWWYAGYQYGPNTKSVKEEAKEVAKEIEKRGYHTYVGWMETTPNGNERVIIQILPYEPKYKNSDDEESAEMQTLKKNCILGLLCALLAGIAYSALMYFLCNQ